MDRRAVDRSLLVLASGPIRMDSLAWLDEIATRFERSWRSGNRRVIEDFLPELAPEKRDEAVIELAIIEYELRLEMGDSVETREYRDRFPAAAEEIIRAVESRFPTLGTTSHRGSSTIRASNRLRRSTPGTADRLR